MFPHFKVPPGYIFFKILSLICPELEIPLTSMFSQSTLTWKMESIIYVTLAEMQFEYAPKPLTFEAVLNILSVLF